MSRHNPLINLYYLLRGLWYLRLRDVRPYFYSFQQFCPYLQAVWYRTCPCEVFQKQLLLSALQYLPAGQYVFCQPLPSPVCGIETSWVLLYLSRYTPAVCIFRSHQHNFQPAGLLNQFFQCHPGLTLLLYYLLLVPYRTYPHLRIVLSGLGRLFLSLTFLHFLQELARLS